MATPQWTVYEEHRLLDAIKEFRRTQPRGPISWEVVYGTYQSRGGLFRGTEKLMARFRKLKKNHADGNWDTSTHGDPDLIFPPPPVQPVTLPTQTTPVQVPTQTIPLPNQFQSPPPNYLPYIPNYLPNAYLIGGPSAARRTGPSTSSGRRLGSQSMVQRRPPLIVSEEAKNSEIALETMNNKCLDIIRKLNLANSIDNNEMQYACSAIRDNRVALIGLYYAKKDKRVAFIRQLLAHETDDEVDGDVGDV